MIGRFYRYTMYGSGNTDLGYFTFIAIQAQILLNLEIQGAVAKRRTALDAFAASVAQTLVDGIFEIWLLHKFPGNGTRGTEHVFGSGVKFFHIGTVVSATQVAVATHLIGMKALDG